MGALIAYAFALERKVTESNELMDKLIDVANTQVPGKLSWRTSPDAALGYTSQDIEIGAYNVLTLIKLNRLADALKIIKWLATQRNANGGFKSTQDTMIALQALAEYSLKITEEDNNLSIKMDTGNDSFEFDVNEDNELLLQKQKLVLDSNQNSVKAEIQGEGCFVVQSMLRYNVKTAPEANSFTLTMTQLLEKLINYLEACATYTGGKEKTNMVVIEVELQSGFEPTPISLKELPKEKTCYRFQIKEVIKVEDRKPAIAKIY